MTALSEIKERFRPVLAELTENVDAALAMIRPAQDAKFGDFQANGAMSLAKPLGPGLGASNDPHRGWLLSQPRLKDGSLPADTIFAQVCITRDSEVIR